MRGGRIFIIFILVAVAFVVYGLDFDNFSFEENRNELLLILAVIFVGGVYFLRRNR